MIWLALRRKDKKFPELYQWWIANGPNMNRWTNIFGANCLADIADCRGALHFMHEQHPEAEVVEFNIEERAKK